MVEGLGSRDESQLDMLLSTPGFCRLLRAFVAFGVEGLGFPKVRRKP